MKYSIAFSSVTGNTAMLAHTIRDTLPEADCIYCGVPSEEAKGAELIFVGFWTDKGSCCREMAYFLESLSCKKVFLFGTAGFGCIEEYSKKILESTVKNLSESNTIVGTFMCQGRMPLLVRKRYEAMEKDNPLDTKNKDMLKNFDEALSHPSANDLEALKLELASI